jgi:hypothetical protein
MVGWRKNSEWATKMRDVMRDVQESFFFVEKCKLFQLNFENFLSKIKISRRDPGGDRPRNSRDLGRGVPMRMIEVGDRGD